MRNEKLYGDAEAYFAKDPVSYADMADAIKHRTAKPIFAGERGVLIHNEEAGLYTLAADSAEDAAPMLELIEEPDMVMTHLDTIATDIQKRFNLATALYCRQFVYTRERPLTVELPFGVEIRPLTEEDLEYVMDHYTRENDIEYLAGRIEDGMFGAVYNGGLCGFVGCHGEGSMGMLYVAPECRRLGIGLALCAAIVNSRIQRGHIPYDHVMLGNRASMELQKTQGFSIAEKPAVWIYGE